MSAARKLKRLQQPASLIEFVRQFLTPRVWKQARQCVADRRSKPRWDLQPLVLVLVAMTWAVGDSESERFVAARGFFVMSHEARKRPGKTLAGFQKALTRLPVRQLWALAQGVRDEIGRRYAERLMIGGFVPMGCDGSRIECPRSAELEARMGKGSSEASAPTAWVTAFVHLGSGLLWSWRIGKGTADERLHLRQMLSLLPAEALVVADAAYMGYELAARSSSTSSRFCCGCPRRSACTPWMRRPSSDGKKARSTTGRKQSKTAATAAAVSADPCAGQREDQTRRMAIDQHPQSAETFGENGGQILSLEMA
jgi:hypothetical protein